ncbi:MAG: DUF2202 domain-containing protein [Methanoregula sp.]|nr:DUF2202 domain-containing protein [Methanoregula sp.]
METKHWGVLAGAIILVILLVVVFGTGPVTPAQNAGPGAGYGHEQVQSAGTGAGPGAGGIYPTLLPLTDTTPLTDIETAYIIFMREEEQMAHDLYARWAGSYTIPVFSNIADSETMHAYEVQLLIDRYGLSDKRIGTASSGYTDPVIQSLHDSLAAHGDTSLNGALEAGLAIKDRDIADLDMAIANTTRPDIIRVYSNLRQGSENHRSAFLRQLGR